MLQKVAHTVEGLKSVSQPTLKAILSRVYLAGPSPVHANLSAEHAGRINDTGCRKQPDGDQS
jgi:hypothetical protein